MRKYTDDERLDRACLRVAMHIRGLYEERGSSDTRLLEALLVPDTLTIVGQSIDYSGKGRREHVVPRRVIINECHEMLERGQGDAEIAAFIKGHLKIVLITPEECARLDRRAHHGLRQSMPLGWAVGEDVFARLVAAGISWAPKIGGAGKRLPDAQLELKRKVDSPGTLPTKDDISGEVF